MSETSDRRRRTDLDLFVLALIESGISTPYQLQKDAGLSQGATIPTLQRLVEAGFVRQGRPGLRGRKEYKATVSGKRALKVRWRSILEQGPSGDLDADLRVALLALWVSRDRSLAAEFLGRAATDRVESIELAPEIADSDVLSPLAYWYNKLRSEVARALLEAESIAARAMADGLPQNLSVPEARTKGIGKLPK